MVPRSVSFHEKVWSGVARAVERAARDARSDGEDRAVRIRPRLRQAEREHHHRQPLHHLADGAQVLLAVPQEFALRHEGADAGAEGVDEGVTPPPGPRLRLELTEGAGEELPQLPRRVDVAGAGGEDAVVVLAGAAGGEDRWWRLGDEGGDARPFERRHDVLREAASGGGDGCVPVDGEPRRGDGVEAPPRLTAGGAAPVPVIGDGGVGMGHGARSGTCAAANFFSIRNTSAPYRRLAWVGSASL